MKQKIQVAAEIEIDLVEPLTEKQRDFINELVGRALQVGVLEVTGQRVGSVSITEEVKTQSPA